MKLEEYNDKFYTRNYSEKYAGLSLSVAKRVGDEIGVDWDLIDLGEFVQGIKEELEHTGQNGGAKTKVIEEGDYISSGRIAYEHLLEVPDYYSRLEVLETEGEELYPDEAAVKAYIAKNRKKYQTQWDRASQESGEVCISGKCDVKNGACDNCQKCDEHCNC